MFMIGLMNVDQTFTAEDTITTTGPDALVGFLNVAFDNVHSGIFVSSVVDRNNGVHEFF